jgi:hypothetical protein
MISIPGTAAIACIFGYFFSQDSGDNGTSLALSGTLQQCIKMQMAWNAS